jgi:hypothetical protein
MTKSINERVANVVGQQDQTFAGNLARNGSPKRNQGVAAPVHPGMSARSKAFAGAGGDGGTVVGSGGQIVNGNVMPHAYSDFTPKRGQGQVPVAHGMKEQTDYGLIDGRTRTVTHASANGPRVLNDAQLSGSTKLATPK